MWIWWYFIRLHLNRFHQIRFCPIVCAFAYQRPIEMRLTHLHVVHERLVETHILLVHGSRRFVQITRWKYLYIIVRTHALYISYNVFIRMRLIFTHTHSKTLQTTYFVRVLNGMKESNTLIENNCTETSITFFKVNDITQWNW